MTEELMVAGRELEQGHSTRSGETENKTCPGAQQPLDTGEAILQWGKAVCEFQRVSFKRTCVARQNLVCVYVSRVTFSLQLQAVLSLNSSFVRPVTSQTSQWHPESCWEGLCFLG